jgi:hypothetical protein
MTKLTVFTPQERALLGNAPLAAATAVAMSDAGGGKQEASALLQAWRTADSHIPGSELVAAIIVELDPETRAEQEMVSSERADVATPSADMMQAEAVELCHQAVQVLEAKATPEEVMAYKRFVLYVVMQVAQAAANGGVFWFGGVSVSLEEQAALRAIRVALDYTPPELSL